MKNKKFELVGTMGIVFIFFALVACGQNENAPAQDSAQIQNGTPKEAVVTPLPQTPNELRLPDGIAISVTTPDGTRLRRASDARRVPARTQPLLALKRTIEGTDLTLSLSVASKYLTAAATKITVSSQGDELASASVQNDGKSALKTEMDSFRTPYLTRDQRAVGFTNVNYELMITSGSKQTRVPFTVSVFDESEPTYVVPRKGECLIYSQPERASGCYQNRTRSTQEVVFNDGVAQSHELDVQYSGGFTLPISIIGFSFGVSRTGIDATQTSHGSEIHFTNCILCSSVIYRQEVKSVRKGDVYQVRADGSVALAGETTVTSSQFAYEFTSTGSESNDYNCDIASRLPVGYGPSCSE